ncbi:MAG: ABC transporter permease [Chloroflexi bacterium]|uniref:ABC transporter permease n=1 Tax=Candidatus Flexifilum breve TaxID=3140694 RepID=UPI003136F4A9|nr:ABC transporter permease [Chloroflexota bacterium]
MQMISKPRRNRALARLLANPMTYFGGAILLVFVLAAIFAPQVAPHDPYKQDFSAGNLPPLSPDHVLGTDDLGRDTLSRLIYGGRSSLTAGLIVVALSASIGVTLGLISGFYGGVIDSIIMRLVDILYAFPFLILAIAVVAILGPGLFNVMIVLGSISWIEYSRVVRSVVLQIKVQDYVLASRALGASNFRIMFWHILPNCVSIIIVQATFSVAGAIIAAAALSFLGFGAQPPEPEWGAMLNAAQRFIRVTPVMSILPGTAIILVVIAINLIGDALRDALDPNTQT